MEVRALCTSLLVILFLLLATKHQSCYCALTAGTAFPLVVPNRQQFFEYETIQLNCKGLDLSSEWSVMRKLKTNLKDPTTWKTSRGSVTLNTAYILDNGEYWCENEDGDRSNSLNITVTVGDVILDSPSVPVMEGDNVSLRCRKKESNKNISADFYNNGNLTGTGFEGTFTIHNVSKSDEGFYKCNITGAGESPESWLSVRDTTEIIVLPPPDDALQFIFILSVTLIILVLSGLLLVVGLLHCLKHKLACFSSGTSSPGENFVSGEESIGNATAPTYADIKQFKKREESGLTSCSEDSTSAAGHNQSSEGDDVVYSAVKQ